ncbi:MAG: hypothetical protein A2Y62_18235 [Candidatus Fischerbacteria bacterium RBG_13_37_8]|uniref:LOG family protein n=1 Tax=Candidatus Fischerbacteria bacterium RBG_13_37_8 TaxID=1817863 RepID=A0A1F5VVQ8_9BACT|nr:MAG: hypothetical protein A2Y62_18235 [Candidatus Fischerbacteria bacterium RBG_13_37_8]
MSIEIKKEQIMTGKNKKIIAVFGSAAVVEGEEVYELARRCGRLLAESGYAVINGAYTGVMEAASKGAHEGNGYVMGVPLTAFKRDKTNDYIDELIWTHSYEERIITLVKKADAYLIFKGGIGTLSELFFCWCMAQISYPHFKPLILVGPEWKEDIKFLAKHFIIPERDLVILRYADTPEDAIKLLNELSL